MRPPTQRSEPSAIANSTHRSLDLLTPSEFAKKHFDLLPSHPRKKLPIEGINMNEVLNLIASNPGVLTAIATAVIAVSAVFSAIITWKLAKENRLLRKAGTEPKVVAYLTMHPLYFLFINFVLANVGRGPARNVSFKFDADEEDFDNHNVALRNSANRNAISFLPQGESICLFFGDRDLFKEPRLFPFEVIIDYDDMNGKHRREICQLDVAQFEGHSRIGTPPEKEIADALKKIQRNFSHFASGFERLKVETITTKEVCQERAEVLRRKREQAEVAENAKDQ